MVESFYKEKDGEKVCPVCNKYARNYYKDKDYDKDEKMLAGHNNCLCYEEELGFEKEQRNDFELKKYTKKSNFPKTLICQCGNDEFTVGKDTFFTALKCKECGVEVVTHEG